MKFAKSFGLSLLVYMILNFVMNLLLIAAGEIPGISLGEWFGSIGTSPWTFIASFFFINTGLAPAGLIILDGIQKGSLAMGTNLFLGIMYIISPLVPALITVYVAGKTSETHKKAIGSWLLVSVLCSVVLLVFWFIAPAQLTSFLTLPLLYSLGDALWTSVWVIFLGLLIGLFWSGLAASMTKTV